jgi:myo-inositol 2-dehydrogenase/D-chiro-inositol 1-dehydrogenase
MGARAEVRVGVVGVGRIGALHARTLLSLDGVDSLTLADLNAERAAAFAGQLGAASARTLEALVEAVDALVIAAPTPAHRVLLTLAAATGLPAFCEKPVAVDLPTLDAVIEETAGLLVQVGFQRRFDAGYRAAREAVASGALGNTLALRAATHDPAPPPEAYIATSGGIFRDLHIHDFDAIRYVTGREIVEVCADGAVRAPLVDADGDGVLRAEHLEPDVVAERVVPRAGHDRERPVVEAEHRCRDVDVVVVREPLCFSDGAVCVHLDDLAAGDVADRVEVVDV